MDLDGIGNLAICGRSLVTYTFASNYQARNLRQGDSTPGGAPPHNHNRLDEDQSLVMARPQPVQPDETHF